MTIESFEIDSQASSWWWASLKKLSKNFQMLVDFTGSLSSLTQEPTHSLSTLHLNKVIVIAVVDFLIVFVIPSAGVFGGRRQL